MKYTKELIESEKYDIVVCGGGFSGFAAAYAAGREGKTVLLIERNNCIGGVGTQGLVNHILGVRKPMENGTYQTCIGGIFAELERRMVKNGYAIDVNQVDLMLPPHGWKAFLGVGLVYDNEAMKLTLESMLGEVDVKILYGTDVIDVMKEDDQISGLVIHNKSGLQFVKGKYFVDATGDGDICAYAGCNFMLGDEKGETSAASLEMHVENVDYEALTEYMRSTGDTRFREIISKLKEAGEWQFPYDIFISVMLTQKDVFMINTIRQVGINGIEAQSLTHGVIEGRKENFALFSVMKKHFPGFQNAKIRSIAPTIGIRETRRIEGEYVLAVGDLIDGKQFDDSIALSAYGWDMPDPRKPSIQPFDKVKKSSDYTQIPYRCLLPKSVDNLIVAGRCVSVEREVLGVVRVMGPCIAMGEAAGIASTLALENGACYKNIDIRELQNRIHTHKGLTEPTQIY